MQPNNLKWLSIRGKVSSLEPTILFIGENRGRTKKTNEEESVIGDLPSSPSTVLRSDTYFESGEIQAKVFIEKSDSKVHFRFSSEQGRFILVGINVGDYPYGIAVSDGQTTKEINVSGEGSQPTTNKWFDLQLKIGGSQVEFFVNHIKVANGQAQINRAQLELALQGLGKIEIKDIKITSTRPRVFVVMQFSGEYTVLYKEIIEPVCAEYGYEVIKGDNVFNNSLVIEDINIQIKNSSLIIADITPDNPNVYYEVGYAHALNKPTILLSDRSRERLPFDVSAFRVLFYDNTIGGKAAVENSLRKHLDALRAT